MLIIMTHALILQGLLRAICFAQKGLAYSAAHIARAKELR